MMKKTGARFIPIWISIVLLAGCAQPAAKVTDDFKRIRQVDQFIQNLENLVQARDVPSLKDQFSPGSGESLEKLDRAFQAIDKTGVDLIVDRILLDGDQVRVAMHWEYRWAPAPEAEVSIRRGNATMEMEGSDVLRIRSIEGENPFLAPLAAKALPP